MTDHMTEQNTDTDVRTLDAMRRDALDLDDHGLKAITKPLEEARHKVRTLVSNFEDGSAAWAATVDEMEPVLDEAEQGTLSKLEAARRRVLADQQALTGTGYRPGLPAEQIATAEAKANHLRSQIQHLEAIQAHEMLKGAVLHGDVTELAAWAMIRHELSNRFPGDKRVPDARGNPVSALSLFGDLLRQCESKTGDRKIEETRETLQDALVRLNQQISELTLARTAHNPGGFGSKLLSYEFGARETQEQLQFKRKHDPDAVAARLGRRRSA